MPRGLRSLKYFDDGAENWWPWFAPRLANSTPPSLQPGCHVCAGSTVFMQVWGACIEWRGHSSLYTSSYRNLRSHHGYQFCSIDLAESCIVISLLKFCNSQKNHIKCHSTLAFSFPQRLTASSFFELHLYHTDIFFWNSF